MRSYLKKMELSVNLGSLTTKFTNSSEGGIDRYLIKLTAYIFQPF